jgi:predicted acyltransferase
MLVWGRQHRRDSQRGSVSPRAPHLSSLDAFRGMTVAAMILVNNPGNWSSVFESLTHSEWHGCTLADLVFPFFIFILGAAMPFAFARRVHGGQQRGDLYRRIARRSAWLIALGLLLNVVAAAPSVLALRIPGVLQRIGVVYFVAALIVLHTGTKGRAIILSALIFAHWALLVVPLGSAPTGLAQAHNLAAFIDRAVFGNHTLTATGDPAGILGIIPAIASALFGSIAGDWLQRKRAAFAGAGGLVLGGFAALVVGIVWATALPLNKSLWTGSFVLFTSGIAALILAACYLLFDVHDYRSWATPFLWLGFNPLAIYFLAELLGHLLDAPWPRVAGPHMTTRAFLFWDVLQPLAPGVGDEWLSLAFALVTVALWTAVAGELYRRGLRIQV